MDNKHLFAIVFVALAMLPCFSLALAPADDQTISAISNCSVPTMELGKHYEAYCIFTDNNTAAAIQQEFSWYIATANSTITIPAACTGTPADDSCDVYDQQQCEGITGCEWTPTTDPGLSCLGTPLDDSCAAYNTTQCAGIEGCSWDSQGQNCTGAPTNCSIVGEYDPTGSKCDTETPGCYWVTPTPGSCAGTPTETCEELLEGWGENKCRETDGCEYAGPYDTYTAIEPVLSSDRFHCASSTYDQADEGCYLVTSQSGKGFMVLPLPSRPTLPAGAYSLIFAGDGLETSTDFSIVNALITNITTPTSVRSGDPVVREFYLWSENPAETCRMYVENPQQAGTILSYIDASPDSSHKVRLSMPARGLWLGNFTVSVGCLSYAEQFNVTIVEHTYAQEVLQTIGYAVGSHVWELAIILIALILCAGLMINTWTTKKGVI